MSDCDGQCIADVPRLRDEVKLLHGLLESLTFYELYRKFPKDFRKRIEKALSDNQSLFPGVK